MIRYHGGVVRFLALTALAACSFRNGHALVIATGDAQGSDAPADSSPDAPPDAVPDAAIDAPAPTCWAKWTNGTIHFGSPQALATVNSTSVDRDPFVTHDQLTLYFSSERTGGSADVYVATRTSTTMPFGNVMQFGAATTSGYDSKMAMTADGLLLVLASDQSGTKGGPDIWQATRTSTVNGFGTLDESNEGKLDSSTNQLDPFISPDGLRIYYAEGSTQVIQFASRGSTSSNFGTPVVLGGITSASSQADPTLSEDELVIVFSSGRSGSGFMGGNLWYATRTTLNGTFGTPLPVPDLNTDSNEGDAHLSADGCQLYFSSDAGGDWDLYVATAQ